LNLVDDSVALAMISCGITQVKAAFGRLSSYDLSEYGNNGTNHPRTPLARIKGDAQNAPRQAAAHSQQD
jgi:hypothetical protein